MEAQSNVCGLCKVNFASYKCPKCHVPYCSLACYKGDAHASCSESFYKDQFLAELKTKKAAPEEKTKMLEMLKRIEDEHADDEDTADDIDSMSLEERLQGINLEDVESADRVWELLTPAEKKEFSTAISSGVLLSSLEPWVPWWVSSPGKVLVSECLSKEQLQHEVPPLRTLMGEKAPSWSLTHNLVDLIFSYCFLCRVCNGDVDEDAIHSLETFSQVSPVWGQNIVHPSAEVAIKTTLSRVYDCPQLATMLPHIFNALEDVCCIFSNSTLVEKCLMHLLGITISAKKASRRGTEHDKKKCVQWARKSLFLCSWWQWVCTQGYIRASSVDGTTVAVSVAADNVLHMLKEAVAKESVDIRCERDSLVQEAGAAKREKQQSSRGPLITELS